MTQCVSPLDKIADWVVQTQLDDIPKAVIERAIIHLMDGISVALAASDDPSLGKAIKQFATDDGDGPCSLVTGQRISSPALAALINAMAAHTYDYDDTSFLGIVHGTAVLWPAAMAMTQKHDGHGRDLLLAFIIGSEALYCLGECVGNDLYGKGWWASATLGIFGATVAAGKSARLNQIQMRMALRLAATHAFGVRSVFGAASKPFMLGRTAQAGVECAQFGLADLSSPKDTFEGAAGFIEVYNRGYFDAAPLSTLGKQFRLVEPGVAIKLFPVCSAAQAGTEAVRELITTHEIDIEQICKIDVRVTKLVATQLRYAQAQTVEEAQFCLPFTVACILERNQLSLDELTADFVTSEAIQTLMSKVSMIADDTILEQVTNPAMALEAAHAYITLKSGNVIDLFNPMATGMPGKKIPPSVLDSKFSHCVERTRELHHVRMIMRDLMNIETLETFDTIFEI